MELAVSQAADGRTVLSVSGDIDAQVADQVRDAGLAAASCAGGFAIDLSQVSFIDSSGLAALIAINNALQSAHSQLTILNPSRPARRILQLTGLDAAFTIIE
jgi:anti-sigma B factor antagonist